MKPVISVIIPAYNEEAVLGEMFSRLDSVMQGIGEPYELIFVNDGSDDKTAGLLRALADAHPQVHALHLSRNFGHQMAMTAGLDAAQGDAVVIIDADLQDPPEVIPLMVEKWREGYDVVYGRREKRTGESVLRRMAAWASFRLLRRFVHFEFPPDSGDFRLVSRRVVDVICSMREHGRYMRGMFAWVGFKQTEVRFARDKRFAGTPKQSLWSMLKLAVDGFLTFTTKPLDWITWLGLLMAVGGVIWLIVLLILSLSGSGGFGTASLVALGTLLIGMIVGCVGLQGAYLGRIYHEMQARPIYIIAERNGYKDEQSDENA